MSLSDPLGDMLTRIRNGQNAKLQTVSCPASKLLANVLNVLAKEGFIRGYKEEVTPKNHKNLVIELKYADEEPVIKKLRRVSTPGQRVYSKVENLQPFHNGLGVKILTTPQGVMSDYEARKAKVGGEVLAEVF